MKSNKRLAAIAFIIIAAVVLCMVWWKTPIKIINIQSSEVSKIHVFNGGTGKSASITDLKDIKHVIDNLNDASLKKSGLSVGRKGYSLRITIFKANGKEYKTFIINSVDNIRKDPFFYQDPSSSIDYDYVKEFTNRQSD